MRRPRASSTLAACFVASSAVHAQAAPGRFELVWSAPDTCPNRASVEQRVERILNRAPTTREDELLIVRAAVEAPERNRPWRVDLETDNGLRRSNRLLEAASCEELAGATALLIAILIEPSVESSAPSTPPPISQAPLKPIQEVSTRPATPLPSAGREGPPPFALGAFAGAVSGLLPAWSFGFGAFGSVSWRALRWNLSFGYWLPVQRQAPDNGAQGARFRLISGDAELCLLPALSERVSAGICSGAELAFLRARGYGQGVQASTEQANFVSLSAGALLSWALTRHLAVVIDADALLPLGSRHFVFEGSAPAQIHTPGAGVQLTLGMQFLLGGTGSRPFGPSMER